MLLLRVKYAESEESNRNTEDDLREVADLNIQNRLEIRDGVSVYAISKDGNLVGLGRIAVHLYEREGHARNAVRNFIRSDERHGVKHEYKIVKLIAQVIEYVPKEAANER